MKKPARNLISLAIALTFASPLYAADFIITSDTEVTTPQTLNDNETGTIEAGGLLNTAAAAISAVGINNTVNNSGSIATTGSNAYGINSDGANATITNSGSIATTDSFAIGINSDGANASITNSGSIATTEVGATGIFSRGANATFTNSGSIATTGGSASGIFSAGIDASITNSGSIATTGGSSNGIFSFGTNASITNSGNMTTAGFDADGIQSDDANASITNSGSIATSGGSASGIFSAGIDASITNSGSIATSGNNADGVFSDGAGATITNSGSIATSDDNAASILSGGAGATINNSGNMTTIGSSAFGVFSTGANTSITNSGSIATAGLLASGIESDGANANITNSGSITTTVDSAGGIISAGIDASITNSGSIATTGGSASGVSSFGTNATITNSGSISTTGGSATAIRATGDDAVINNSGLISATGAGSFAILGDSSDSTLNLLTGSQIIGAIDLGDNGGDNDTVNIHGGSVSANLTLLNVENINLLGATGVVIGDNVITIDPTGESTRSVALANLTSAVHGVISQRMTQHTPLKPVKVAALTLSPGMLFQERAPMAWGQAFGGTLDRDNDGQALAYEHEQVGFTFGYEQDLGKVRVGWLGGFSDSELETVVSSFKTDIDSYYVGGYGHFNLGVVNLTTSLLAGYSEYDNDRLVVNNITGLEKAKSDFNSSFLSPSGTLSAAYSLTDRLELRPSVRATYSVAWLDGYRESGTTSSNLTVDDRTIRDFIVRVQLAAAYKMDQNSEFEFRAGLNNRHTNDDDVHVSVAGGAFSFDNATDESVTGGYGGLNIRVAAQDNLSLVADMELGGNGDESYAAGHVSVSYLF